MKTQSVIDFSLFKDKKQCHEIIKKAVGDYEGTNLDALFDHLTSTFEQKTYKLVNTTTASKELCDYAQAIVAAFTDAAAENDTLNVEILEKNEPKTDEKRTFFSKIVEFSHAKPIFLKGKCAKPNVFASFKTVVGDGKYTVNIAANYFYKLFLNGKFLAFGPARTAKNCARVDKIELPSGGEIVILVAAYNCRTLTTCKHDAFLCAEITDENGCVVAFTGRDFEGYLPSCHVTKSERYSSQRHFCEVWDFSLAPSLTDERDRAEIEVIDRDIHFIERYVDYPKYDVRAAYGVASYGSLVFDESLPYNKKFYSDRICASPDCFTDDEIRYKPYEWVQRRRQEKLSGPCNFPISLSENTYAIIDLDRIETGFISLDVESDKGAEIVIGFSEDASADKFVYTDMHCHNAAEFIVTKGTRTVTTFEPYVLKYAIVCVASGSITLNGFSVIEYAHDMSSVVIPDIEDEALASVYRGAVRTFAHNAVDIYTDCPSRERAGWLCDSYFTGKVEKYLLKNSKTEEAFLENYLLFEDTDGDYPEGVLPMCFPSDPTDNHKFIPQWTMWYIIEICDYIENRNPSADREMFRKSIEGLLAFYERYENADGLLEKLPSWNFVEWSVANKWTQDVNYPTNFLYARVLECVYILYGDEKHLIKSKKVQSEAVRQSFNGKVFLDHAVRNDSGKFVRLDDCSEAGQYYAILFGGIDLSADKYSYLRRLVFDVFGAERTEEHPEIAEINAFIGAYLRIEALLKLEKYDILLRDIKELFGNMEKTTGTLWEYRQRHGSRDHGFASYALVAMMEALHNK